MIIPNIPPSVQEFLDFVLEQIKPHNVALITSDAARVNTKEDGSGISCSGFFEDRPTPRLAIALGKPWEDWLPILAHEFSHFTQFQENASVWTDLFQDWGSGVEEATSALDRWLAHEMEWDNATLDRVIEVARNVELDCEMRTLKLIEDFNLPVDAKLYAQKSNAYVYFYNRLAQTRTWYPSNEAPYEREDVWSNAPNVMRFESKAPPELEQALIQAYPMPKSASKPNM